MHDSSEVEALTSQLEAVAILDDAEQGTTSLSLPARRLAGGGREVE